MKHDIMKAALPLAGLGLLGLMAAPSVGQEAQDVIRIGMIGLDTSHVTAFTSMLNDPDNAEHVPGARVVAAFKGGSPDLPSSWDRVDGYTKELEDKWGVEIVDSIEELCTKVDAVMIESVDGRPHLEQAKPLIEAGIPFFLDKPVAGTLEDGLAIARLAKAKGVPWFGGSSLRWWQGVQDAIDPEKVGDILGCDAFSPCSYEEHHPDLFWYGTHGVSILYAAMGQGCHTVTRFKEDGVDVVVGLWEGGRVGTFRGTRAGAHAYGCTVFGTKGVTTASGHSYKGLVEQIVRFFHTKESPCPVEEILEELAFMQAADDSAAKGGAPVAVQPVSLD